MKAYRRTGVVVLGRDKVAELEGLGFRGLGRAGEQGLEVPRSPGQDGPNQVQDPGREETTWEVEFPHVLMEEAERNGIVSLHEAASYLQARLWKNVLSGELESDGLVWASGEARVASLVCQWLERVLGSFGSEGVVAVRAMIPEVPLREPDPNPTDAFLQTRTVSLEEAKQKLEQWRAPAEEEVLALEVTTEAVERVKTAAMEKWVREGRKVFGTALPSLHSRRKQDNCNAVQRENMQCSAQLFFPEYAQNVCWHAMP